LAIFLYGLFLLLGAKIVFFVTRQKGRKGERRNFAMLSFQREKEEKEKKILFPFSLLLSPNSENAITKNGLPNNRQSVEKNEIMKNYCFTNLR